MFMRRNWPMLLLAILFLTGYAVFVVLTTIEGPYLETSSARASGQLSDLENQDEPMLGTTPEVPSAPETASGAIDPAEFEPDPEPGASTEQGAKSPMRRMWSSIVGSLPSAADTGMQSVLPSSGATSVNSSMGEPTPLLPAEQSYDDDDDDGDNRGFLPSEPLSQPNDQCGCPATWR